MQANPLAESETFEIRTEVNPLRPVASQDRFESIRAIADQHMMDVRWNGKREARRSYLTELLEIVNGTGRRISAVCQLRYMDLRLSDGPHGSIRWPADTDKMGRETLVPIGPRVRSALDRLLRERPGAGDLPLFPSPTDRGTPLSRHQADKWLRAGEKMAEVEPLKGSLWHAYRRKWATERKHLPDVDVAAAGGWKTAECLRTAYQQADQETMLKVVLEAGELREAR
ncbi:tyrosine-type recombinase/integrase [Gemmatimonadota bacterium]